MWLESRDDDALVGRRQPGGGRRRDRSSSARREPLGDRRFRLSRLLRGRRGTEWAAGGHAAGEAFTLIEPDSLVVLEAPAGSIGGEARVLATGIGDDCPMRRRGHRRDRGRVAAAAEPGPSPRGARRRTATSPSPGCGAAGRAGPGRAAATRRSARRASATGSRLPARASRESSTADAPVLSLYGGAERAADGGRAAPISVIQIGTFAASRPALPRLSSNDHGDTQ